MTLLSCSHHSGVRNELYRVLYLMYIHSTTRGDSSETPTRRAEYCRVVQTRIHHSSPDMQSSTHVYVHTACTRLIPLLDQHTISASYGPCFRHTK